ncbi:MAG: hypothetical protein V4692_02925 [Bdellovibrionota bacterium]
MRKFLLSLTVGCAFVSGSANAGVSSYKIDGKQLSIDRIGFYLDPSLSEAITAALKQAATQTNKKLGREAVQIETKMEAGVLADQDLVSTISFGPIAKFEAGSEKMVGTAYWEGDSINEVDVELNANLATAPKGPDAAKEALQKFLNALITK